jgi:DNA-binding IclR family transcriptional regulator
MNQKSRSEGNWFFFTNHLHVLLYVARNPDAQVRVVAMEVGLTERAAHRILSDLAQGGYITVTKNGRRNHYRVNPGTKLRHRANIEVPLEPLLEIVNPLAKDIHPET